MDHRLRLEVTWAILCQSGLRGVLWDFLWFFGVFNSCRRVEAPTASRPAAESLRQGVALLTSSIAARDAY